MSCFRLVAITSLLFVVSIAFSASCSYALSFKVISDPVLLSQENAFFGVFVSELTAEAEAIYDVNLVSGEITQDRAYVLDPETGEVTFGDGLRGSVPPSGAGVGAAAYRYGSGSTGTILNPVSISLDALPVLIQLDDPSTNVVETEIRFFLLGITSFDFEVSENGVWVTAIKPVPEPTTILLLGSGLLGLAGFSRKFRKKC